MNEGLDSDFFKRMYPSQRKMTHEEYRNARKRTYDRAAYDKPVSNLD